MLFTICKREVFCYMEISSPRTVELCLSSKASEAWNCLKLCVCLAWKVSAKKGKKMLWLFTFESIESNALRAPFDYDYLWSIVTHTPLTLTAAFSDGIFLWMNCGGYFCGELTRFHLHFASIKFDTTLSAQNRKKGGSIVCEIGLNGLSAIVCGNFH